MAELNGITRRAALAMVGAAAAVGMLAQPAIAEPTTLRFGTFVGPTSFLNTDIFVPWFEQIEEASDGTVKIEFLSGGSAAKPQEVIDAVKAGLIDIGWSITAYNPGRFNAAGVSELPILTQNPAEGSAGMAALLDADMLDGFDGVKVLGVGTTDVGRLHHAELVDGLDAFQGAKVRAAGRVLSAMLKEIGATPVGMPITSVAESLSKHIVDGAVADWFSLEGFRLIDVTKTHLDLAMGAPAMYLAMNPARYDQLPDAAKAAFEANPPAAFAEFWGSRLAKKSAATRDEVAATEGHRMLEPTEAENAEWQAAADGVIADWIANNENGQAVVDTYSEAVSSYRASH
ncbi:TRAP transporter substrate-binding protein [Amorphus sp. 3PC139-8]|uniref:TRAP transporter substrate-binding protein n=1 Tax=Amorphus sp. 3PC139-8 TaxID=2735676 RepID=UPI00345DACEE